MIDAKMTTHENRIESLNKLINWLDAYLLLPSNNIPAEYANLDEIVEEAHIYNPWLIAQFNKAALADFSSWLKKNTFDLGNICKSIENTTMEKKIALLLSQNVPLRGVYELVILYLVGYKVVLCNKDHKDDLLQCLTQKLLSFIPEVCELIQWKDAYPRDIDGWILYDKPDQKAIHQYFEKRNTLFILDVKQYVVLDGNENKEALDEIADRVFIYWGFSQSNIRKVHVPLGYIFNTFFEALERYSFLYQYNCYANNYDYHRSILLMDRKPFLDNGFIILREDASDNVPIGCLYYSHYSNESEYNELKRSSIETKKQSERQNMDMLVNFIKSFK